MTDKPKLSTLTFSQVAANWLDSLHGVIQDNGRSYPASTLYAYSRSVKRASETIGNLPIVEISNEVIRSLVASMRADDYSPASIRRDLVRAAVAFCLEKGAQKFATFVVAHAGGDFAAVVE